MPVNEESTIAERHSPPRNNLAAAYSLNEFVVSSAVTHGRSDGIFRPGAPAGVVTPPLSLRCLFYWFYKAHKVIGWLIDWLINEQCGRLHRSALGANSSEERPALAVNGTSLGFIESNLNCTSDSAACTCIAEPLSNYSECQCDNNVSCYYGADKAHCTYDGATCGQPVNCSTTTGDALVCRRDNDTHVVLQHVNDNNESCDQILCTKGEKLKHHERWVSEAAVYTTVRPVCGRGTPLPPLSI